LQDYLKAVDSLTISDNKSNLLQKQMEELTEKNKEENYIIKGQLAELAELKARQEEAAKQQDGHRADESPTDEYQ
jgi:hypothetical protein